MTLNFNLNGAERKNLVSAISTILEAESKYLGAPSFAYQVGEYQIDKHGTLEGPDNIDLEDTLHQNGFTADAKTYVTADNENDHADNEDAPIPGESSETKNENYHSNNTDAPTQLTIEMSMDGFSPEKLDNLCKLITAKEALIKAALGADELPIRQTGETIKFPWFCEENRLTAEEVEAYATFINLICETAKAKKRITAKEKPISGSPKYAMRCFLLSLGMIGAEYKSARKILLSKLDGNSSWKNGAPAKEEAKAVADEANHAEAV